jgi:hypothetical protein
VKCYELLTREQLDKHRAILLWMLGEVDLELSKRNEHQA